MRGNVRSLLVFQLGAIDAELLERQFRQALAADKLMNIPKYHAYR